VFFRRKAPLFRGSKGPVHKGLAPVELRCFVELREKRSPQIEPHVFALPLAEATPASRRARILFGQVLPASAGAQNPEDALEALAIIDWWTAAAFAGLPLWQMRLDPGPLLVGETFHDTGRSRPLIARKISARAIHN
jgi:hypothetical protein